MRGEAGKPGGALLAALLAGLLLAQVLVLPGCRPEPAEPPPEAVEATPKVLEIGLADGVSDSRWTLGPASSLTAVVPDEPFRLTIRFAAEVPAGWTAEHRRIEPAAGVEVDDGDSADRLDWMQFPAGPVGETIKVTYESVGLAGGTGSMLITLRRAARSVATRLEVLDGDAWRLVESGECLAEGPLELRVTFSGPVNRASVEKVLAGTGATFAWESDTRVGLRMEDPPGYVALPFEAALGVNGLAIGDDLPPVYAGGPPSLCAYDPATGEERRLCDLMVDISRASISPDGSHLLVEAYLDRAPEKGSWLVDVATGERREFAFVDCWLDDQTLAAVSPGQFIVYDLSGQVVREVDLPAGDWEPLFTLSPDHTKLAILRIGWSEGRVIGQAGEFAPADLIIVNLDTGRPLLTVENLARRYVPGSADWPGPRAWWSPDGQKIPILSVEESTQAADGVQTVIRLADLKTGEATTLTAMDGFENLSCHGTWTDLIWSPDGRYWAAWYFIIGTSPPYEKRDLDGLAYAWGPDGRRLAWGGTFGWTEQGVYEVDQGESVSLGVALGCGWDDGGRLYLVRWPGRDEAYVPPGP